MSKRIGELLSVIVPLSGHDIEEVLQEQSAARASGATRRKRFGDIALALGLCRPEHVWKAWCGQLEDAPRRIDLDSFGIDTQALAYLDSETAEQLNVIPVRVLGDELILATDGTLTDATTLLTSVEKKIRFVFSDGDAIRRAIASHYHKLQAAG